MSNGIAERTLPHNLEAERSVLGAILIDNRHFDVVAEVLREDDFFRDAHRRIFKRMTELSDVNEGVDFVTLKEKLAAAGELDEVGGPAYIASVADGVPRATNVEFYARIVREHAIRRELIYAANGMLGDAYEGDGTIDELLGAADRRLLEIQSGRRAGSLVELREGLKELVPNIESRIAHRGELVGVDTGFSSINDLTGGWKKGTLNIIAARPSVGKTTLATDCAVAAARTGKRVAIFSLEMERQELEYRIVSSMSGIMLTRLLGGFVAGGDYAKLAATFEAMHALDIEIDDSPLVTVWDIRATCRRMKAERGIDLVVIDYVQLMPSTLQRRGANRTEEIADISRRLKLLAREIQAPVLLLSQLNRANESRTDPRPRISDLRESGSLEQDADTIGLLHRPNYRQSGTTEFILGKQRNGPTGTVNLTVDLDIVHFVDGGEDLPPEPAKKARGRRRPASPGEPVAEPGELPIDED